MAKTWKRPKHPLTDKLIEKMWYLYMIKDYSAIKKDKIIPYAASWIQLEIFIPGEVNHKEKDKYHIIYRI